MGNGWLIRRANVSPIFGRAWPRLPTANAGRAPLAVPDSAAEHHHLARRRLGQAVSLNVRNEGAGCNGNSGSVP